MQFPHSLLRLFITMSITMAMVTLFILVPTAYTERVAAGEAHEGPGRVGTSGEGNGMMTGNRGAAAAAGVLAGVALLALSALYWSIAIGNMDIRRG